MKIYEIEGPDGVGKSTTIDEVLRDLKDEFPERTFLKLILPGDIYEGARNVHRHKEARALEVQEDTLVWSDSFSEISSEAKVLLGLAERTRIAEELERLFPTEDVVVLTDRGVASAFVYDKMLNALNSGDESVLDKEHLKKIIADYRTCPYKLDGVIFLDPQRDVVDKEDMPYSLSNVLKCYDRLSTFCYNTIFMNTSVVCGLTDEAVPHTRALIQQWAEL